MKELTKAQEEVLQALWEIKDGAVTDVLRKLPYPKPAYNTVATVIKVLEKKGYVSHKTYGKTFVYFAIVSRNDYAVNLVKDKFKGIFNSSVNQVVSFFVKQKSVSISELEELKQLIENEISKQKNKK